MQFYNVHSHIFTMRNAPQRFLQLFLPAFLANFVDKSTNTQVGAATIQWLMKMMGGNLGKRYASFLQIGKSRSQLEVFETLRNQYDDPSMKFVALTMYMEKTGVGNTESGFEGQLEEIISVKKQYPDHLLVFMGIDPRWCNTGRELKEKVERYFEQKISINATRSVYPFIGLKIYPSLGFYAFDEKLKETFEWAAQNGVPVLSHCNYLGGIYTNDSEYIKGNLNPFDIYKGHKYSDNFPGVSPPEYQKSKKWWKWPLGQLKNDKNLLTCSYFLEPASYITLIESIKELKICLAHYGGEEHILGQQEGDKIVGMNTENWYKQIKALIKKAPNVYTDIAFAVANPEIHQPVFDDLKDEILQRKIMFGTDFFLTERILPEKSDYAEFKQKALKVPLGVLNAWEQMASANTDAFLKSKYYNGTVI